MSTIKELFEKKRSLQAQIDVYEEVLSLAYDMKGLKEKHGEDAVDDVLTKIDEVCRTPLREELEKIDKMEVGDGEKKRKSDKKASAKKRGTKASKGNKAAGSKAR